MIAKLGLLSLLIVFSLSAIAEAENGLERVGLSPSRTLDFKIVAKSKCYMGDIDILLLEMREVLSQRPSSTAKPILTLQSVLPQAGFSEPSAVVMSADVISSDGKFKMQIPKVSSPVLAGVYICIDEEGKSCREKKAIPHAEFLKRYALMITQGGSGKGPKGTRPARRPPVEDKVYFFRYLVITPDAVLFSKGAMTDDKYVQLEKVFQGVGSKKSFAKEAEELKRLGILGSVPLDYKDGAINIVLPFYDYKRCFGSAN